jgi:hypothetical protein
MKETFIDRLPGTPDSLSRTADGGYLVPLVAAPPLPAKLSIIRSAALRTLVAWATTVVDIPVHFIGAVLKVGGRAEV